MVYSHPSGKVCRPPPLLVKELSSGCDKTVRYLSYRLSSGCFDWNYPFDLCASIYRLQDVSTLIDLISQREELTGPNRLEYLGNEWFRSHLNPSLGYTTCLCPDKCMVVVITVNRWVILYEYYKFNMICRVQTEFPHVPVYSSSCALPDLNSLLSPDDQQIDLDLMQYRHTIFPAVHIGNIVFQPPLPTSPPFIISTSTSIPTPPPEVSVLVPVLNGEKYLRTCLNSLLTPQGLRSFEVLILDDGSQDSSWEIAEAFRLHVEEEEEEGATCGCALQVRVIRWGEGGGQGGGHIGLAASLQRGLHLAR